MPPRQEYGDARTVEQGVGIQIAAGAHLVHAGACVLLGPIPRLVGVFGLRPGFRVVARGKRHRGDACED